MSAPLLKIAVVGHTNAGKTSLLRTLTRDETFGEVSDRPAVTRHVEGVSLLAGGRPVAELYDTPGLEDSIGLFELLRGARDDPRTEGALLLERFLAGPQAAGPFSQEAKALRQVLASDVALYVIDARERVLGKHRDELAILALCSRPIVPVLNFVAGPEARTAEWREHLARTGLHAVAEFDTVVFDEVDEGRLYEKLRSLLDAHRDTLTRLIEDRREERRSTLRAAASTIADLLVDAAACVETAPARDPVAMDAAMDRLRAKVQRREERAVEQLLELFRFSSRGYDPGDLPVVDGRWGVDPFHPEALRSLGIKTTGAAAAGATVGLGIDIALLGHTLGAGTAIGAALGALWGAAGREGRRFVDWFRGSAEVRCSDATLLVLQHRQIRLVRALLRRGHGSVARLAPEAGPSTSLATSLASPKPTPLPSPLRRARAHPEWWRDGLPGSDAARREVQLDLAREIEGTLASARQ